MIHSLTPPQFVAVLVVNKLTPDEIVGKWFATAQGMRGYVRHRLDTIVYAVTLLNPPDGVEQRLMGIGWMRECRFFDSLEACEAKGVEAWDRGATMEGAG